MRVGLVADTHIPEAGPDLPPQAYEAFGGCDLIIHAGDVHVLEVLDRLERVAPVVCCRGNGDMVPGWGNRPGVPDDPRVDDRLVLDLDGVAVGVVHDIDCYYYPRDEARFAERLDEGLGRRVDLVVCGDASPSRAWGLRCRESMDDAPCLSGGLSLQC